ncbi:MAG: antitoxin component YwqK of YwqJK toxin-antitoxin module [Planctomycetota bacterium]|jgi:antitoxin component YwqK of YwqJK toxin-antitoxin module
MRSVRRALLSVCLLALCACGPPEGERRELALHFDGPKPSPVRVRGEQLFHDGEWIPDGDFVYYDKQGNVTHRGQFELGLESGDWSQLSKDGVTGTGRYNLGERHGDWTYHYASKLVREEGSYDNGKRIGIWSRYYSDGSIEGKTPYVDGKIEGEVKVWDTSGKPDPESSGYFKNGERVR